MADTPNKAITKRPSANFHGKAGRSGAPKGSQNAIRHGLTAGRLPKDCRYIEYRMNALRRQIEAAVIDAKREVSLTDAAFIQTALRWERHAQLSQRWLTKMHNEMKPEQLIFFSKEISRASAERDKSIAALQLGEGKSKLTWLQPVQQ